MKTYIVKLTVDNGSDYLNRICIISANDDEEAKKKAFMYINKNLPNSSFATVKSAKELIANEDGVLYQTCFRKDE